MKYVVMGFEMGFKHLLKFRIFNKHRFKAALGYQSSPTFIFFKNSSTIYQYFKTSFLFYTQLLTVVYWNRKCHSENKNNTTHLQEKKTLSKVVFKGVE